MSVDSPAATDGSPGPRPAPPEGPGVPIPCPECRYDLRGLAQARCPECGVGLQILAAPGERIAAKEYRRGLVGLIVTAAIGGLLLLSAIGIYGRVLFFALWLAGSVAAIAWWRTNGQEMLARQYPDVRRAIVLACWLGWTILFGIALMIFIY